MTLPENTLFTPSQEIYLNLWENEIKVKEVSKSEENQSTIFPTTVHIVQFRIEVADRRNLGRQFL
jgi:hypothetical protein